MTVPTTSATTAANDPPLDWMDRILLRDADELAGDYIADDGFTARVVQRLPRAGALPAWRRPALVALWAIAAVLVAVALPGVALDVARAAYKLFAARPFSLSTIAFTIVAVGVATWTAAAVALRRD
jgi:hypothetical protein